MFKAGDRLVVVAGYGDLHKGDIYIAKGDQDGPWLDGHYAYRFASAPEQARDDEWKSGTYFVNHDNDNDDDEIVEMKIGELTAAFTEALKVVARKSPRFRPGDPVIIHGVIKSVSGGTAVVSTGSPDDYLCTTDSLEAA